MKDVPYDQRSLLPRLPNAEDACVPLSKINKHLPLETHGVGRAKAKFFRAIGFEARAVIRELDSVVPMRDRSERGLRVGDVGAWCAFTGREQDSRWSS